MASDSSSLISSVNATQTSTPTPNAGLKQAPTKSGQSPLPAIYSSSAATVLAQVGTLPSHTVADVTDHQVHPLDLVAGFLTAEEVDLSMADQDNLPLADLDELLCVAALLKESAREETSGQVEEVCCASTYITTQLLTKVTSHLIDQQRHFRGHC
jgi:hypothetical protein